MFQAVSQPIMSSAQLISTMLAVAATKINRYQMLHVVFELLMMGRETT
jgi:hypothetical protein